MTITFALLLLLAALILAIVSCFPISTRVPLLAIAVICLSVFLLLTRGVLA